MERFRQIFEEQQACSRSTVRQRTAAQRIARLRELLAYVLGHQGDLCEALARDFGKPAAEVEATELYPVSLEIRHAVRHLRDWMRPLRVPSRLSLAGTRSEIIHQPRGVVLIIAPWNFPFMLTIGPLVSAIAAGNCVILKPSELAPHTAGFLSEMIRRLFDPREVALIEGGPEETIELLKLPFNHIFFTGSTEIGRRVMTAAAGNLTSVTLELGGKCPAIVDETASLSTAAERLVWGKFLNAGQACVAPDYVRVQRSRLEALVEALEAALTRLYPGDPAARHGSPDYARIVSDRHFRRVLDLLDDARRRGARVRVGGESMEDQRFIAPTILTDVPAEAALMDQEVFGPLLPVLPYDDLDQALAEIDMQPRPLAVYVFSRSRPNVDRILARTSAGGTVINDTMIQFIHPHLPFGGVDASGMGRSHGYYGFKTFSNSRGVVRQRRGWSTTRLLYPPYTPRLRRLLQAMIRRF